MQAAHHCRILTQWDNGERRASSGATIGHNRVLTCWHSIRKQLPKGYQLESDQPLPDELEIAIRWPSGDKQRSKEERSSEVIRVCWYADSPTDLAILECDQIPAYIAPLGLALTATESGPQAWWGRGYPVQATEVDNGQVRARRIDGSSLPVDQEDIDFQLTTNDTLPSPESWGGVSGTAVVINGEIAAVVTKAGLDDATQKLRLKAALLEKACAAHPELEGQLQPGQADAHRQSTHARVLSRLQSQDLLSTALGRVIGERGYVPDGYSLLTPEAVTQWLFKLGPEQFLHCARRAQLAYLKEGQDALATALTAIAQQVLPLLLPDREADRIRQHIQAGGSGVLEVDCHHEAIAELHMARAGDRDTEWEDELRPEELRLPAPRYRVLGLPRPEEGPRSGACPSPKLIALEIQKLYGAGSRSDAVNTAYAEVNRLLIDEFVPKESLDAPGATNNNEVECMIGDRLTYDLEEEGKRYYLILPKVQGEAVKLQEQMVAKLNEAYPPLLCLQLSKRQALNVQENRLLTPLAKLIFKAL